ncbi:MAG: O-antigen ligase family protein [Candidatus Spechtbacterales bacterium]
MFKKMSTHDMRTYRELITPLNIIFTTAFTLVVLIAFNIIPREGAFVFFLLYALFVLFYPIERGVDLFLRSIPFFIALPITESFDNFNIWRIILALIFIKWFFVEYTGFLSIRWFQVWMKRKASPRSAAEFTEGMVNGASTEGLNVVIRQTWKHYRLEVAGILFLLLASVSVFVGPDTIAGLMRFVFILNAVMLFIVIRSLVIKNKENAMSFAKNFAYSGILAVAFGYVQFIAAYFVPAWVFHYWWGQMVSVAQYGQQWGDITTNFGNTWFSYSGNTLRLRMFSTFPDSHSFPMYVIMTFPALFMWLSGRFGAGFRSHLRVSLVLFVGFGVINLALILSGTRGIWLASVVALFVVALFKATKIDKKYRRIVLSSLLVFLLMFPLYFGIVSFRQFQDTEFDTSASFARIRSIIDFGETSNQGRIFIWKKSIEYIVHSPVWGVGIGNYPVVLNEPQSASAAGASAHNLYLHIASTIGIIGLLAFLWMMFEIVKESIKYLKTHVQKGGSDPALGLYIAMMLFSLAWVGAYLMTDAALYDGRALLGFMAMIGMGVGLMRKNT